MKPYGTFLIFFVVNFFISCSDNNRPTNSRNTESSTQSSEKTDRKESEVVEFNLAEIDYDHLSQNLQSQVEGAGCQFSLTKNGNPVMLNGLIRVNGIYEFLESSESGSDQLMIYENEHWLLRIKTTPSHSGEEGSIQRGTMTLRSKQSDQSLKKAGFVFCGC